MDGPLRILLADDDEDDRFLFTQAFKRLKTQTSVHTVDNGQELIDYLNINGSTLPHLIFIDLNMPRKNGIECLKEIKENKKFKEIFIAIYSTSESETDIEQTFLNGANIYIKKENDFETLVNVLKTVVLDSKLYQDPPYNKDYFLLRI